MSHIAKFRIKCTRPAQPCVPLVLCLVLLAGVCAWPSSVCILSAPPALAASGNQRSAVAHFKRGLEFSLQQNWKSAETAYREAIRLDPNNPRYRAYLSSALAAQGKFAQAQQSSQQEKQLKKMGYKPAPFERTRTRTAAKSRPRIATPPVAARLTQPGTNVRTTSTRNADGRTVTTRNPVGDAFDGLNLPDIASGTSGSNASTADSASGDATLANATRLYEDEKWPQAEAEYRRVLRANPQLDDGWNGLGDVCAKQNKWSEAEKAYREAVRLKPQEGLYHAQLAKALLKQGRRAEALKETQTAVGLGLEDHEILDELELSLSRTRPER